MFPVQEAQLWGSFLNMNCLFLRQYLRRCYYFYVITRHNFWGGGGVRQNKTAFILLIMLTTCFGHCGPSSGHKNVYRGNLYRYYDHTMYSFPLYTFL